MHMNEYITLGSTLLPKLFLEAYLFWIEATLSKFKGRPVSKYWLLGFHDWKLIFTKVVLLRKNQYLQIFRCGMGQYPSKYMCIQINYRKLNDKV